MHKAFVSWSGGKDSALAWYLAKKNHTLEVVSLLTMLTEEGDYSRSHGLRKEVMGAQAASAGIDLVAQKSSWQNYEEEFKKALIGLKAKGVCAGVFGDIDVQAHRDWVERVCEEVGMEAFLPLWNRTRHSLMEEFIGAGFRAKIVAVNQNFLGRQWLGREIDHEFVCDMQQLKHVDLCGENGEYHTFVYDGPFFQYPVEVVSKGKVVKEQYGFLDLILKK